MTDNVFAFSPKTRTSSEERLHQGVATIFENEHGNEAVDKLGPVIAKHREAGRHEVADVFEGARDALMKRRKNNVTPFRK